MVFFLDVATTCRFHNNKVLHLLRPLAVEKYEYDASATPEYPCAMHGEFRTQQNFNELLWLKRLE